MNDVLPDYFSINHALEQAESDYSAAEAHGIACGMLVIKQTTEPKQWLKQVVLGDEHNRFVPAVSAELTQLFVATRQQINSPALDFTVFLPEDAPLAEQVEAMQTWCQGFGLGLAVAGVKDMKQLPADSREWAEDVVRIGTANDLDLEDTEESEEALAEIVEYLRVGVLMMNEEMQPIKQSSNQIH